MQKAFSASICQASLRITGMIAQQVSEGAEAQIPAA